MTVVLLLLALTAVVAPLVVRSGRFAPPLLAAAPLYGAVWVVRRIVDGTAATGITERYRWVPALDIDLALRLDGLAAFFALLILGIGTLVVLYAGRYLHDHGSLGRFYLLLLAFMASMLGLVLADGALPMFVFWEATSLTSYLLIGFDHDEESSRVAARKALVVTGSGGLALLGGLIMLHEITGSWSIAEWTSSGAIIRSHALGSWALGLVLLGAFTKSAQVPFHFWLPAAMAGPTPVSAYLHSATMVKAGVFLLARLSPIWAGTSPWLTTLVTVGAATMALSAWAALRYRDLKSVLAYTTSMALGLLVMLLGFGDEASIHAAMGYLLVHALYKGALFMVAGSVDHGTGTRDLDRLSGLFGSMRWTGAGAVLACASMAGLPPFIGFIGKELAYEANLHAGTSGLVALVVSVVANAALFGVSAVVALKPFFGSPSEAARHGHEDLGLALPPLVLAVGGLACGLVPGLLDPLLSAASSSVLGAETHVHLALWHGVNLALLASGATYAAGVVVFLVAARLRRSALFHRTVSGFTDVPARAFERGLLGLAGVARGLTGRIYVGKLRRYVFVVVLALALGLLWASTEQPQLAMPSFDGLRFWEAGLLALLVVSAGIAAYAEPPMKAIIVVGISGYCVAIIYLLFGAPDVAMTQLAIETLTVILVVLTLLHLPSAAFERPRPPSVLRDLVLGLAAGGATSMALLYVLSSPLPSRVSNWYLQNSVSEAHGRNIVNVILVDFRGFDTWGEITVLTIAGLGVYALLRPRAGTRRSDSSASQSPGNATSTKASLPRQTAERRGTG